MSSTRNRQLLLLLLIFMAALGLAMVLRPFLLAMATGCAFAFSLTPLRDYLKGKLHFGNVTLSALITVSATTFFLLPMGVLFYQAYLFLRSRIGDGGSFVSLKSTAGKLINDGLEQTEKIMNIDIPYQNVNKILVALETKVYEISSALLSNLPETLLQIFIALATMYFVLSKNNILQEQNKKSFFSDWAKTLVEVTKRASRDVILANMLTGLAQATMVTLGAHFFSDYNLSFIFIFTFFVSFIPVIGAGPVAALIGLAQIYNDAYINGTVMIVLSLIVGMSDNVIRALAISRRRDDSTFLNFVGTISGVYLWGIAGLFIGPVIVSVCYRIIPKIAQRLKNISEQKASYTTKSKAITADL